MTVRLTCDAPGCGKETVAEPVGVSFRAPDGWWMQVGRQRIIVACCTDHLNEVLKSKPS